MRASWLGLLAGANALIFVGSPSLCQARLTARSAWFTDVSYGVARYDGEVVEGTPGLGWLAVGVGYVVDPLSFDAPAVGMAGRVRVEFVGEKWSHSIDGASARLFEPSHDPGVPVLALEAVPRLKVLGIDGEGPRLFVSNGLEGLSLQLPVSLLLGLGGVRFREAEQQIDLGSWAPWLGFAVGAELAWTQPIVRELSVECGFGARWNLLPEVLCPDSGCESVSVLAGPMLVVGVRLLVTASLDEIAPHANLSQ